ncbi:MAG: hypothetical protein GC184_13475 [Rhizobiales bacterium]|nr:hypothetical protein [Hyphomicrobiales bacterium]
MSCVHRLLIIATLPLALAGCTAGNFNSIHRTFDLDSNKSQFVDVKQRSILVGREVVRNSDGSVATVLKRGVGQQAVTMPAVCAEPSPDALAVYATALSAEVSNPSGVGGSANFSSSEAASAFGLRTQSIQLLRDAYYRACEARLGHFIDDETYDVLIRRLNNQAIAYLAIESITESVRGATPEVKTPDLGKLQSELAAANKDLEAATKKQTELEAVAKNVAAADKAAADKAVADNKPKVEKAQTALNEKAAALTAATKPSITPAESKTVDSDVKVAAVNAAKEIALQVVNGNYSPQMCFSHLRLNREYNTTLLNYCTAVLEAQEAAANQRTQLYASLSEHCTKSSAADVKLCNSARESLELIDKSSWSIYALPVAGAAIAK